MAALLNMACLLEYDASKGRWYGQEHVMCQDFTPLLCCQVMCRHHVVCGTARHTDGVGTSGVSVCTCGSKWAISRAVNVGMWFSSSSCGATLMLSPPSVCALCRRVVNQTASGGQAAPLGPVASTRGRVHGRLPQHAGEVTPSPPPPPRLAGHNGLESQGLS